MNIWRCDVCEYDNDPSDSHCVRCEYSRQIMEGGNLVDRRERPYSPANERRDLCNDMTDLMCRLLHYQDSGEPDWAAHDYERLSREWANVPEAAIQRFRSDAKFNAQVKRAVALLMDRIQFQVAKR